MSLASHYARAVYQTALLLRGETGVRGYLREFEELERTATPASLLERQRTRLSVVLSHAARAPFYRRHWARHPTDSEDPFEFLAGVPFLEKRVLQHQRRDLETGFAGRVSIKRTGGSTGEPAVVRKCARGVAIERAVSWLGYGWFGVSPGAKVARFWGAPFTRSGRLKSALGDFAMRRVHFSAFEMEPEDLRSHWRRCLSFGAQWFYGYASFLDLFAGFLEDEGLDGARLGLRSIVSTAEPLDDRQRRRLTRVFQAPVQDEYGCGETGAIAYSCEEGRLHVMSESVLVEVLLEDGRPAGPGESGELVLTDLNNLSMPLVRYRIRDSATVGPTRCSCGRPWPTLDRVWGRVYDMIITPAGRRWHGTRAKYLLVDLHESKGGFDQFQIIQTEADRLEVRLVMNGPLSQDLTAEVRRVLAERLDGMEVDVRKVESVERAPSGKLRLVRNDWLQRRTEGHGEGQ